MKASDLHISVGSPPMVRHDGEMKPSRRRRCSGADTQRMLLPIAPERNREKFARRHDTDFAYEIARAGALPRATSSRTARASAACSASIPSKIMTAEEMGLSPARSCSSATSRRAWCS